jgi:hypothetical protein
LHHSPCSSLARHPLEKGLIESELLPELENKEQSFLKEFWDAVPQYLSGRHLQKVVDGREMV